MFYDRISKDGLSREPTGAEPFMKARRKRLSGCLALALALLTFISILTFAIQINNAIPAFGASYAGGAPYNLRACEPESSDGTCVLLRWNVDSPQHVRRYRLYRAVGHGDGFSCIYSSPVSMRYGNLMDFVDTGLEPGIRYFYFVEHFGAEGAFVGRSNTVSFEIPRKSSYKSSAYKGKRIVISIAEQRIYFLENEVLVRSHLCSTGVDSHPTPLGVFKVLYHQYLLVSERYGGVYCYWWMGFAPDTGMHAIPYNPRTKTWTGASMLGKKASHGCVRQAVADAEWAYKWAPDGTRIDVIPQAFMPPQPVPEPPRIKGGHASQGISELSRDWYFAEGYTGGDFNTYILIMNPNHEEAVVDTEFMRPDGSVILSRHMVKPLSRFTVHLDKISGLDNAEVSTHIHSNIPVAAERAMYFDYMGRNGGSSSCGVRSPSLKWYLAEGYTGPGFDEYLLFQNPSRYEARVRVTFMLRDGTRVKKVYSIKPRSRFTLKVNDVPEAALQDVSTMVESNVGIIVERAQYFEYAGKDDGNASCGLSELAKTWFFAEGYTAGGFDEYILIQNPSSKKGLARVAFMRGDGEIIEQLYELHPSSRFTIRVDDIPGLESCEVSALIESDLEIVCERAMYFESGGRPGGSDAPGVTAPSEYWYLAEGYTGGEFDTYILIFNPNDEEVYVDVNYLLANGGVKIARYQVKPHSRYTIHVDVVEGLENTEFSTALTGSLPIVCERAMYFSMVK